jgi:hypothetical protein
MAEVNKQFTVGEVLQEVLTESGSEDSEKETPTLAEVLRSSLLEFYPLRGTVRSFTAFCEEAIKELEGVYKRHKVGVSFGDRQGLPDKRVNAKLIIASEVMLWLKVINRRMTGTRRARNPWYIEFKHGLPKDIFLLVVDFCSESPSSFGFSVQSSTITFTHKKRLVRDLSKLAGIRAKEINDKLQKVFKGKREGCKAELVVTCMEPFVLSYDERNMNVVLKCHYGYWNELGYAFHG